jgi:hypothetical protein
MTTDPSEWHKPGSGDQHLVNRDTDWDEIVWQVVCEDGQVRHVSPFDTWAEASNWAHWQHGCLAVHTYRPVTRRDHKIGPVNP